MSEEVGIFTDRLTSVKDYYTFVINEHKKPRRNWKGYYTVTINMYG